MNASLDDSSGLLSKENAKLKEQIEIKNRELDKLEHVLLANLAHKEQEIADLSAQIEDMKASSNPCNQQLRCMGLDPAVNAVFLRIKKDMKATNDKLEQTQNDLQAWKFTPDSQTGKRMMTRMRVLLQENEELGKINQSGRTAKLESELAMKRTLIEELKQTNSDYENVIDEMDTETDCFQTSIFMLQQQLAIARTTISSLCNTVDVLSPGRSQEILAECHWIDNPPQFTKDEPMEVEQEVNGSNCAQNHLNSMYPGDPDFPLLSSKFENNCNNNDSSLDDRTTNINTDSSYFSDRSKSAVTVTVDVESKKHSVKSNSAFNQKKKLTSS